MRPNTLPEKYYYRLATRLLLIVKELNFTNHKIWDQKMKTLECQLPYRGFDYFTYTRESKLAIGFVRFESLRGGFVDSRFESEAMDSKILKFAEESLKN